VTSYSQHQRLPPTMNQSWALAGLSYRNIDELWQRNVLLADGRREGQPFHSRCTTSISQLCAGSLEATDVQRQMCGHRQTKMLYLLKSSPRTTLPISFCSRHLTPTSSGRNPMTPNTSNLTPISLNLPLASYLTSRQIQVRLRRRRPPRLSHSSSSTTPPGRARALYVPRMPPPFLFVHAALTPSRSTAVRTISDVCGVCDVAT
jgi:hypothetical protein